MSSPREGSVIDEYGRPVPGATIYVFNQDGTDASLFSDEALTIPLPQPVLTDQFGIYSYYAADGVYREDTYFGGKLRYREMAPIGEALDVLTNASAIAVAEALTAASATAAGNSEVAAAASALASGTSAASAEAAHLAAVAINQAVSDALAAGTVSDLVGTRIYTSKAALLADLVPADALYALVIGDATAANNDLYKKSGATGTGSWAGPLGFFAAASAVAQAAATAATASASSVAASAQKITNNDSRISLFEEELGDTSFKGLPGTPATGSAFSAGDVLLYSPATYRQYATGIRIFGLAGGGTIPVKSYTSAGVVKAIVNVVVPAGDSGVLDIQTLGNLLVLEVGEYFGINAPSGKVPFIAHTPSDTPYIFQAGNAGVGSTVTIGTPNSANDIQFKVFTKRLTQIPALSSASLKALVKLARLDSALSTPQTIGMQSGTPAVGSNFAAGTIIFSTPITNISDLEQALIYIKAVSGPIKLKRASSAVPPVIISEVTIPQNKLAANNLNTLVLFDMLQEMDFQNNDRLGIQGALNTLQFTTMPGSDTPYFFSSSDVLPGNAMPSSSITGNVRVQAQFSLMGTATRTTTYDMAVPDILYAAQNRPAIVYAPSLLPDDIDDYSFAFENNNGIPVTNEFVDFATKHAPMIAGNHLFSWLPDAALAATNLDFILKRKSDLLELKRKTISVVAVAATARDTIGRKINEHGDSTTAQSWPSLALKLIGDNNQGPTFTMLGSQSTVMYGSGTNASNYTLSGSGSSVTINHEGHSGVASSYFVTAGGPAMNGGSLDYAYYSTNSLGGQVPDELILSQGINDVLSKKDDSSCNTAIAAYLVNVEAQVDRALLDWLSTRMWIATRYPTPHDLAAMGLYGSGSVGNNRYRRNIYLLNQAIIGQFKSRTGSRVLLLPDHMALDGDHNWQRFTAIAPNIYTPDTVTPDGGGPHPGKGGSQVGELRYAAFKS